MKSYPGLSHKPKMLADYDYITEDSQLLDSIKRLSGHKRLAGDTEAKVLDLPRANGLDPHTARVRLLSFCAKGGIPQLWDLDTLSPEGLALVVQFLSSDRELIFHNATYDVKLIFSTLGLWLPKPLCSKVGFQTLALATGFKAGIQAGFSLESLVRDLLGVHLEKELGKSNWGRKKLSPEQLNYAALDVGAPKGKRYSSCLLTAYEMIEKQAFDLGMKAAWDLNQEMVTVVAQLEYKGLKVNQTYLKNIEYALISALDPLKLELADILKLQVDPMMKRKGGQLLLVRVPAQTTLKLLNNKAKLVDRVNEVLGLSLPNLEGKTLEGLKSTPEIEKLIIYTRYAKLLSEVQKYIELTHPITGALHSNLHIVGTATNRNSSSGEGDSRLNIQQIAGIKAPAIEVLSDPWGYNLDSEMRTVICTPREAIEAPDGFSIYDADYSKQEIVIAACIVAMIVKGGEPKLLESLWKDYRDDVLLDKDGNPILNAEGNPVKDPLNDIYVATARNIFAELSQVALEELDTYARTQKPAGVAHDFRKLAKIIVLAIMYGKAAPALALEFDCELEEAERYLRNFHKTFKALSKYIKTISKLSAEQKRIAMPWYGYLWVAEANAKGVEDKASIGRKGVNASIQSLGAIMIKLGLLYMKKDPILDFGRKSWPVAVVHDGLVIIAPGKSWISHFEFQKGGWYKPVFAHDEEAAYYGDIISGHMKRAMKDTLFGILQDEIPAKIDMKISKVWLH